jgi:hypothetical protein
VEDSVRDRVRECLVETIQRTDVLPRELIAALRLYDHVPGSWLMVEPWDTPKISEDEALSFLANALVRCVADGHAEAMVKFVGITWGVLIKDFTSSPDMIDVLKVYPRDPKTVGIGDSMIRASFNARKAADYYNDQDLEPRREAWARQFWIANSRLSPCLVREDAEDRPEPFEAQTPPSDPEPDPVHNFVEAATAEYLRFLDVLDSTEIDLHDPRKQEVISGLISRAARATVAMLQAPHMWCGEHGATHNRLLAETEFLLVWLDQNGPQSYADYQSYGRGKAKLMKTHMAKLMERFDEPPERLRQSLLKLDERLGGDWGQELIPVNLDSTFSGKSVRAMAFESGLEDIYRYVYQPASGVGHGEWWTLEDYALQRCLNPLHRFHWIPSVEPIGQTDPDVASLWVSRLAELVSLASKQLTPPAE